MLKYFMSLFTKSHKHKKTPSHMSYVSPVYSPSLQIDSGHGDFVYDIHGKKYIDFTSGIAVNALGHTKKYIQDAFNEQSLKIVHASNLFVTKPQLELCQYLCQLANHSFQEMTYSSVFLSNSGTEANECALKFAKLTANRFSRDEEKKYEIISCYNSFHGRSMGSLSVTGQNKYKKDFHPLLPGALFVPFNDIESLSAVFNKNTAAIIIEPIQGEGGLEVMTEDFAKAISDLAKKFNALIIVDEVQTGLYRTGPVFASQRYELNPDLITLSKSLGGGFPIGAVITSKKVHKVLKPGDHGSTTGGNPVICNVALATLKKLNSPVQEMKKATSLTALNTSINSIIKQYPLCKAKGLGHLQGIELPTTIDINDVIQEAQKCHLLILRTGTNTIRIAPSLICSPHNIKKGMRILSKIIKKHLTTHDSGATLELIEKEEK